MRTQETHYTATPNESELQERGHCTSELTTRYAAKPMALMQSTYG